MPLNPLVPLLRECNHALVRASATILCHQAGRSAQLARLAAHGPLRRAENVAALAQGAQGLLRVRMDGPGAELHLVGQTQALQALQAADQQQALGFRDAGLPVQHQSVIVIGLGCSGCCQDRLAPVHCENRLNATAAPLGIDGQHRTPCRSPRQRP
ncbi:hypothetical protein PVE_R2G0961 [Pseudomonas veronii 1YdBTEX2]|uniref:Uncharacterized protein n=1 Tax=Pseudomonas veronii 1YdBTEX2 TaxID=1295141 RepID=A0A1D3K9H5_PSEVE|nr:hypothetical protein PVE_R2G0961 [Pseudomonas veronii 1YdBTEX2]